MKSKSVLIVTAVLLSLSVANAVLAAQGKESVVTAVFSRPFNHYQRAVQADGSPKIQTYNIAKGGYAPGLGKDASIDDVRFDGMVRVLGKYLAKQGYYPAKEGKKADLMVVVHWGKTVADKSYRDTLDLGLQFATGDPFSSASATGMMLIDAAQDMRYAANKEIANLLGYTAELDYRSPRNTPILNAGAETVYYDLVEDLEAARYYVAITAYDFQELLQRKQSVGLWRTVVSIDARENRFDERLTLMLAKASPYFGKDSGRLVRQFDYVPRVDMGELKVLGVVDDKPATKD